MQGKPEWKKHETGPFGEYLYTQEDYHKLRARLATYEAALREIDRLGSLVAHDLVGRLDAGKLQAVSQLPRIARKALEAK